MLKGKPFSNEWLDSLKGTHKIIVTGPQRSGTRFVGMLLDGRLKNFKYMNKDIHEAYECPTILHTPGQSHKIHTLSRGTGVHFELEVKTLVVWVDRNTEDVIESEDRIYPNKNGPQIDMFGNPLVSWHERCFENEEKPKYLEMFPEHEEKIKSFDRNVHMKKWVWENIQKSKMVVDFVELKYESLEDQEEFVSKEQRKDWTGKQVRISGRTAYHN